jgi:hypothetical protein
MVVNADRRTGAAVTPTQRPRRSANHFRGIVDAGAVGRVDADPANLAMYKIDNDRAWRVYPVVLSLAAR